jgi:hypothetical protein
LEKLERTGFPEEKCKLVRNALEKIIETTNKAEDSFWRPCVFAELQQILDIYKKWNGHGENADLVARLQRRRLLDEMRALRDRMHSNIKRGRADRSGEAQQVIMGKDDEGLGQAVYDQLKALAEKHPETFKVLKTAVMAFEAKSMS